MCVYVLIGHSHLPVTAGEFFLEIISVSSPDRCFGWRDLSLRMVVCFFQDCLVSLFCLCMRTCVISCLSSKLFFITHRTLFISSLSQPWPPHRSLASMQRITPLASLRRVWMWGHASTTAYTLLWCLIARLRNLLGKLRRLHRKTGSRVYLLFREMVWVHYRAEFGVREVHSLVLSQPYAFMGKTFFLFCNVFSKDGTIHNHRICFLNEVQLILWALFILAL